jgi:hypothetical protein
MIIDGKAKQLRRIILEIRSEGDKGGPKDRDEQGTPPNGASNEGHSGAAAQPSATNTLVRKAVQYLSRERLDNPASGFDYSPETERSEAP